MATVKQPENKVERYRQRMRAAGFRPVQFWVPDTRSSSFAECVRQQCLKLKNDPEELDILRFAEEAAQEIEGWQ
ncbi:MAG: antitoxin MazE family protein [Brachymonas sp.]|nr:antitoxin MazE family protein [Brachymonas sp.]